MALAKHRGGPSSVVADEASLKNLQPGNRVLVYYHGSDAVWHERVLLWPVNEAQTTWSVLTPDLDMYIEEIQGDTMATHLRLLADDGQRPRLWHPLYAFASPLDEAELAVWINRFFFPLRRHVAPCRR